MLRYIELKSGYADNGPAWIARVRLSKSGRTVYFNGKALKRTKQGVGGNHYDLATGDDYWISALKKDGFDRHWAGGGMVWIEKSAIAEYMQLVGCDTLPTNRFKVIADLPEPNPAEFVEVENER